MKRPSHRSRGSRPALFPELTDQQRQREGVGDAEVAELEGGHRGWPRATLADRAAGTSPSWPSPREAVSPRQDKPGLDQVDGGECICLRSGRT
jgi:hypothetical protein